MDEVQRTVSEVQGTVADGFESVRHAFEANFRDRNESGAAFAATLDGRPVVDLWGGVADLATGKPWGPETVSVINSGTKGMSSFCLLLLYDRGLFELDTPLADFWPGFGARYSDKVTVRHVLAHTTGLHTTRDPMSIADWADSEGAMQRIAAQEPFSVPGTVLAYHAFTFGSLAAGIVKHLDGRSIGRFFAEEFAEPLGIDAWIGFPAEQNSRLATLHGDGFPIPGSDNPYPFNDVTVLRSEIPGAAGVASARAMARLYELLVLGGAVDGRRYLSAGAAAQAGVVLAEGVDLMLQKYWKRGFGFVVRLDPPANPQTIAVNHGGAGGSEHGAWPEIGVTYSYAMNQMRYSPVTNGGPIVMDERAAALINALHNSVTSLRHSR